MIQCRICGNTENNRIYPVYERRKNKGDIFKYLHCGKCGTLQLEYEELDIQKWYEDDYYSFHISVSPESKIKDSFRKGLCWMLPKMTFTKSIRKKLWRRLPWIMYFEKLDINFNSKILDIGCGNGAAVYRLSRSGFKNVLGIDAFCKKTPFPIKYYQCDIFDKRLGKYDFIMLHHSFEHMSNPDDVLGRISDLLLGGGIVLCVFLFAEVMHGINIQQIGGKLILPYIITYIL